MPFHALTFADARGISKKPPGRGFISDSKSSANVNALKQACLIIILAFSQLFDLISC